MRPKPETRKSYAYGVLWPQTGPLHPKMVGAAVVARKRAAEIVKRGLYTPLEDLLACSYLLGIEDAAEALRHAEAGGALTPALDAEAVSSQTFNSARTDEEPRQG